ncbi:hypothetical protein [Xanthomonas maliensis]|uniref:hypothetical protein n=1 Tax=Xanthomonas maliensis TaxID=1321368 RepID=UPI0003A09D4F|nr:hypothetical protein [Xanthomonas maliensis]KAB7766265.1 hypothetical protein CKY51_13515 [Xanthomonas maliensis]
MPNGKPGDHPLSDLSYGSSSGYGEAFDTLARALLKRPDAKAELERIVNAVPSVYMASQQEIDAALAQALPRLRALRASHAGGAGQDHA